MGQLTSLAPVADAGRLIITDHPVLVDGRRNIPADLQPGESLYAFLSRHIDLSEQWEVRIGGEVVPVEYWMRVKPKHGQVIEVVHAVNRQALQLVAMIALTYFTMGAGAGWIAGTFGVAAGGAAATMIGAGLFVAGSVLINKVLGPKPPEAVSQARDSVYSITSARNQMRPYDPVALLFGHTRITPDLASMPYIWHEGDDQYLGMVLNVGSNVHDVGDIYHGDGLLSQFDGVQVYYNNIPGKPHQTIPLYSNADTIEGGELEKTTAWVQRTTPPETVRIQLNIEGTIGDRTSKGKDYYNQETIQAEYRPVGSSTWQPLVSRVISNANGRNYEIQRVTLSRDVAEGQYDVRVRRLYTAQDKDKGSQYWSAESQFQWTTMVAVQSDDATYAGMGRIGIRVRATGQLSGALDQLRMEAWSRPVPVWNGTAWVTETTSNPGALILQFLRGIYDENGKIIAGLGLDDDEIDIPSLQAFMVHCATNDYQYNHYLRDVRNNGDQLDAMARAGFGAMSWESGRWGVVWAADGQPVSGVVNMATIKKGQFQVDYTLAQAADGIEYTYLDSSDWTVKTLRVPAPGVDVMLNPATVQAEGVSTEAHAAQMARWHLAQSLYQYKDIVFSTDLEHLAYKRMDVLQLQHDLTQWGYGGRLVSAPRAPATFRQPTQPQITGVRRNLFGISQPHDLMGPAAANLSIVPDGLLGGPAYYMPVFDGANSIGVHFTPIPENRVQLHQGTRYTLSFFVRQGDGNGGFTPQIYVGTGGPSYTDTIDYGVVDGYERRFITWEHTADSLSGFHFRRLQDSNFGGFQLEVGSEPTPYQAVRSPTDFDGSGLPVGSIWHKTDANDQVIGTYRYNGATWDDVSRVLYLDEPVPGNAVAWIGIRIPGESVYRTLRVRSFEGMSDTIELLDPWPSDAPLPDADNPAHDYIWIYDFKATPGYRVRVVGKELESDAKGASVAVVPEGPEFWNYVKTGEYIPPQPGSLLDTRPKASNVKVSEVQVVTGDVVHTELAVTFDLKGPAARTVIFAGIQGSEIGPVAETVTQTARFRIGSAGTYTIVVRPYNADGIAGESATVTYTTEGADIPPPPFDWATVEVGQSGLRRYAWGYYQFQPADLAGAEIRFMPGTVADPDWEAMTPLGADGFFTAAFESDVPVAGDWTFAFAAINTAGEISPPLIVHETLTQNVGENLDELGDEIQSTQQIVDEILNDFADMAQQIADVQQEAQQAAAALRDDLDALTAQVGSILGSEEWDEDTDYTAGTPVKHEGGLYVAKQDVPAGTPVSDDDYWQYVGDYNSVADAVAAVIQQSESNATEIDAHALMLAALGAMTPDGTAFLLDLNSVRVGPDETLAQRLSGISAAFGDANARIDAEELARANADAALSQRTEAMEARMPTGDGDLATAQSVAQVTNRVDTVEDTVSAHSGQLATHTAEIAGKADSSTVTALSNTVTQQGNTLTAQGTQLSGLSATVGGHTASINEQREVTARLLGDAVNAVSKSTFESASEGGGTWTGVGASAGIDDVYRTTGWSPYGDGVLRINYNGSTSAPLVGEPSQRLSVTPGEVLVLSADTRSLSLGSSTYTLAVFFRDSSGNQVGSTATHNIGNIASGTSFVPRYGLVTVPSNAVSAQMLIRANSPPAGGAVMATNIRMYKQSAEMRELMAKYSLAVTAGGDVAGMQLLAGGGTSAIRFLADMFSVVDPGGGSRLEWSDGAIRVYDGSQMRVRLGRLS